MNGEVFNIIKEFSEFIIKELDEAIEKGEVEKRESEGEIFRWKLEDFEYTPEKGISCSGAMGEYIPLTQPVFIHHVDEQIKLKEEYKTFIKKLSENSDTSNIDHSVHMFVKKLFSVYLREKVIPEVLLNTFSRELKGDPIKMKAFVEVTGLTLEPIEIQITPEIKLRRPKKEDLEKENTISPFYSRDLLSLEYPSAIIEIEIFGKSAVELQNYIEKTITLLRLFGSGGVKYIRYTMSSESISLPIGGTTTSGDRSRSNQFYIINTKDIQGLKKFWEEVSNILVQGFNQDQFSNTSPNLFFSYQRYSEAILSIDTIEKKIVNTISGLESLYLNTDRELSKYLRLSVSKTMSLFGYDPYETMKQMKDSYEIRSIFIHGDLLKYNKKKKFIMKYGSLEKLFNSVVNYLRISIIFLLVSKMGKKEFIDLIEDSLMDKEKEKLLQGQILSVKERLAIE